VYLYDVPPPPVLGPNNVGTLLTHGPLSVWGPDSQTEVDKAGVGRSGAAPTVTVGVRLRTFCWDLRPGHRLALGVDMHDLMMYKPANTATDLTLTFGFDGFSSLLLPVVTAGARLP
jgi:hypothetical protein